MSAKTHTAATTAPSATATGVLHPRQAEFAAVREAFRESGEPLDTALRSDLEPRFAYDFSSIPVHSPATFGEFRIGADGDPAELAADAMADRALRESPQTDDGADFTKVRVHTGRAASDAADAVGAEAFTAGGHIFFADGRYRPHSVEGRRLLAHELAHVVQRSADPTVLWRKKKPGVPAVAKKPVPPVHPQPGKEDPDAKADPLQKVDAEAEAEPKAPVVAPPAPANADAAKAGSEKVAKTVADTAAGAKKAAEGQAEQKQAEPKALSDLASGSLELIDYELAEHERWGGAAQMVGAAESKERADFIAKSGAKGSEFGKSALHGAGFAIGSKVIEKGVQKGAIALAARLGAQGAKFTPLPAVGAVIGGAMAVYQLASRDWKATGEAIGKFGKGNSEYETLANSIDAISNVLDIASQVLNVIAGIIGVISIAMWALTVATAGGAAPLATTLSVIAVKIGIVTLVLDAINSLVLKTLVTLFRSLHAFTSQADPRDVVAQGTEISKSAGAASGFIGGLVGAKAAERGMGRLGKWSESRKAPDHGKPGALQGDGPSVKAEPPAEAKATPESPAAAEAPAPKTADAAPAVEGKPAAQAPEPAKAPAAEAKPAADPVDAAKKMVGDEGKPKPAAPEPPKEVAPAPAEAPAAAEPKAVAVPKEAAPPPAPRPKKPARPAARRQKPLSPRMRRVKNSVRRQQKKARRDARREAEAKALEAAPVPEAAPAPPKAPGKKKLSHEERERSRDAYAALEQLGTWFEMGVGVSKPELHALSQKTAKRTAHAEGRFEKAMAKAAAEPNAAQRKAMRAKARRELDSAKKKIAAENKEAQDAIKEFWDKHGKESKRDLDLEKDLDSWEKEFNETPKQPSQEPENIGSLLKGEDLPPMLDPSVPKGKRVAQEGLIGRMEDMPPHGMAGMEAEHVMPGAQGELVMNPPAAPAAKSAKGKAAKGKPARGKRGGKGKAQRQPYNYGKDSTVLIDARASTIKTHGDRVTSDNARTQQLKDKMAAGEPIDVMKDVFLPSLKEMTKARQEAAKLPEGTVPEEHIVWGAMEQQGKKFAMGSDPRAAMAKQAADAKAQFNESLAEAGKIKDPVERKAAQDKVKADYKEQKKTLDRNKKAYEKALKKYWGGKEPASKDPDWEAFDKEFNVGVDTGPVGPVIPDRTYRLPKHAPPTAGKGVPPQAGLVGDMGKMPKHGQLGLENEHLAPGAQWEKMTTLPGTEGMNLPTMYGDSAYRKDTVVQLPSDVSAIKTVGDNQRTRALGKDSPASPNEVLIGGIEGTMAAQQRAQQARAERRRPSGEPSPAPEPGPKLEAAAPPEPAAAPQPVPQEAPPPAPAPADVAPPVATEPKSVAPGAEALPAPEVPAPPAAPKVIEKPAEAAQAVEPDAPAKADAEPVADEAPDVEPAPAAASESGAPKMVYRRDEAPADTEGASEKEEKKPFNAPTLLPVEPKLEGEKKKEDEPGMMRNLQEFSQMDPATMTPGELAWYRRAVTGGTVLGALGGGIGGAKVGSSAGVLVAGSVITARHAYDKAKQEPIVEHVNPNYAAPPCQPQEIVDLQNQVAETLDARTRALETAKAMAGQESKHKGNQAPLENMEKATDGEIGGVKNHQKAVGDKESANQKKGEKENEVVAAVKQAAEKSAETATIRVPMRGFERFTSLAHHLDDDGILGGAKRGILKMNSDSKRFLKQLDAMDAAVAEQKAAAPERAKQVAEDKKTLNQTATGAKKSQDDLEGVKKDTQALDNENQEKLAEATKVKSGADGAASKLATEAKQKEAKSQSLAAALQAWARGHKQARKASLDATKKRLEDQGYKILEVKEL